MIPMERHILIFLSLAVLGLQSGSAANWQTLPQRLTETAPPTPTPPPGLVETYKVVNGMNIRATVYNVDDSQRHRVAIVIHPGGYKSGQMQTSVAQDLSQYGFMGVAIEYRLAPPHTEMNSPAHPFPGQNDIHDDGYYPE